MSDEESVGVSSDGEDDPTPSPPVEPGSPNCELYLLYVCYMYMGGCEGVQSGRMCKNRIARESVLALICSNLSTPYSTNSINMLMNIA